MVTTKGCFFQETLSSCTLALRLFRSTSQVETLRIQLLFFDFFFFLCLLAVILVSERDLDTRLRSAHILQFCETPDFSRPYALQVKLFVARFWLQGALHLLGWRERILQANCGPDLLVPTYFREREREALVSGTHLWLESLPAPFHPLYVVGNYRNRNCGIGVKQGWGQSKTQWDLGLKYISGF